MRIWQALALVGLCAAGAAAGVFVASEKPDGLERVLLDLGITGREQKPQPAGAETKVPASVSSMGEAGMSGERPRQAHVEALLAFFGALLVGGVLFGVGRVLRIMAVRSKSNAPRAD